MSLPTSSDLEARLRDALQPTHLEVIDESAAHAGHAGANAEGYGTHFRVRIASPLLGGTRVAQHRAIMEALDAELKGGVHALAIEVVADGSPQG